jgi:predicted DsbA family dithiol-disulfide isomerase
MKVEIYSDISCPWCYIGQVRFERALAEFPGKADIEVSYRPYQLNPAMPYAPQPLLDYYVARGGSSFRDDHTMTTGVAAEEGLAFDLERALAVNTFRAHQLMWLAERGYDAGVRHAVKHALMRTSLTDGGDIADVDTLVTLAARAGMDPDRVRADLTAGVGAEEVRAEMIHADEIGVQAVPTFVFDGRLAVRGAQPTATFREILDDLATRPAEPAHHSDNDVCTADSCTI